MSRDKTALELLDDIQMVDGVELVSLNTGGGMYWATLLREASSVVRSTREKWASPVLALQALIREAKLPVTFEHGTGPGQPMEHLKEYEYAH